MKTILFILTLLILGSCKNKTNPENRSLIGMEFHDFKQISQLAAYTKISDTTIYKHHLEPKHGILHLRNQKHNLVVFKSISRDSIENITYKILDTLIIQNLNKPEVITIGYCQINEDNDENLIAIVNSTRNLKIKTVKKVWRANTTSNKIENINTLPAVNCFNEFYSENNN